MGAMAGLWEHGRSVREPWQIPGETVAGPCGSRGRTVWEPDRAVGARAGLCGAVAGLWERGRAAAGLGR